MSLSDPFNQQQKTQLTDLYIYIFADLCFMNIFNITNIVYEGKLRRGEEGM